MLAYAAHRRTVAGRKPAPHALLVIIVAHIALIAAVMSAKMVIPERVDDRTEVELIRLPPPPPPPDPRPQADPRPSPSPIEQVPLVVPVPLPIDEPIYTSPAPADPNPTTGPAVVPQPRFDPLPLPPIVRVGPRFDTPASAVRPPYPASKIASGEEASLKLRLAISEQGRVVAVAPVGQADPAFFAAASEHLLARWRYQPATEAGRAIASSTVITLRFQLEN